MYNLICNKKGLSLVEVLIAIFLTTIGILALLSLQPTAYSLAGKSDHLSRAAAILREELERQEAWIMNSCNAVTTGTSTKTVYSSGQSGAQQGDVPFEVQTTITEITTPNNINFWRVNVRVIGAGGRPNITESIIVTRQDYHKQGC